MPGEVELPGSIAGWELSEVSQTTNSPGGNYEHPYRERVFVNIHQPDVVNNPNLWKAKFNDHLGDSERICVSEDYSEVVDAALDWMRRNPADADRSGQKKLVPDGGAASGGTARYSDPSGERGGYVGLGAVLYDIRDPERRPCCSDGGRCLAHVTGVYEETTHGEVYFHVEDGTHTTAEWVHGDDLLALFEPAGWSCSTGTKPTYLLTREHSIADHHDLITDGGEPAWIRYTDHAAERWRQRRPDGCHIGIRVAWVEDSIRLQPPHGFTDLDEVRYHPRTRMLLARDGSVIVTAVDLANASRIAQRAVARAVARHAARLDGIDCDVARGGQR